MGGVTGITGGRGRCFVQNREARRARNGRGRQTAAGCASKRITPRNDGVRGARRSQEEGVKDFFVVLGVLKRIFITVRAVKSASPCSE